VGDGLPGQAWAVRGPVWRGDDAAGERSERALAAGVRAAVALPLRVPDGPIAVVTLVSRAPREPEEGIGRLLDTIAAHVAQFIQRRHAQDDAAARLEDVRALGRVAHELASQTDLYAARSALCAAVRELTGASSVVLWEPPAGDVNALEVSAAAGAAVRGMRAPLAEPSAAGAAYLTGDPIFSADVAGDTRVRLNWHGVTGAASGAWFPVMHEERCVGVLAMGWAEPRAHLSERDEELLRLLAAEAATTIHRTALLGELQSSARTDPLTGLPNRRVWEEDLARELARVTRHGGCLCLVMLDLDRFKAFNDHNGHPAGDRLLVDTAQAWRPIMRETDTLARYGGEEFAVLLPHSDREAALVVVDRLLAAVPLGQTASAGIAAWDGEETPEALLARADAALYEAKHAGRARAVMAV
jgi:diguanylate cyclase (GGDEF)-like protein